MHDSIPQARVVRKAGQLVAAPRAPRDEAEPTAMRTFLAYALGLWPLTGVVMLMLGLLYMAAFNGNP
jgi:hypothetical protein